MGWTFLILKKRKERLQNKFNNQIQSLLKHLLI